MLASTKFWPIKLSYERVVFMENSKHGRFVWGESKQEYQNDVV